MTEETGKKKGIIKSLNRNVERKALDRSVARDELIRNEEGENNEQDD